VKTLEQLDPTKAKLDELARTIGYTQKFNAKAAVLKAIRQKILGRKGAFERPNA
jgi:predicted transcriptional regulator